MSVCEDKGKYPCGFLNGRRSLPSSFWNGIIRQKYTSFLIGDTLLGVGHVLGKCKLILGLISVNKKYYKILNIKT